MSALGIALDRAIALFQNLSYAAIGLTYNEKMTLPGAILTLSLYIIIGISCYRTNGKVFYTVSIIWIVDIIGRL